MIDIQIDRAKLETLVGTALGSPVRLAPLKVRCTYPVFKGDGIFVKVGPKAEWEQTKRLQESLGDCGLMPKLLVTEPIGYFGYAVFIGEWRDAKIVFPEDFNDAQIESFVAGCVELSAKLQKAGCGSATVQPETEDYEVVRGYVSRHPFVGRLIASLVAIPESERTFGARTSAVVHGDFHAKNFAFDGDRFSTVYDFDKLRQGLACGDLVNALVERYSLLSMPEAKRRRLDEVARRIFARQPWPRDELVVVANILRLQYAARRIRKHPDSVWIAFDVLRRDRRIRRIMRV